MDIERLENATRRITRAMCSRSVNTAYHGFIEDLDELTHWAFQHIAAQSVKSEEVAEAIEELMSGIWQSSKDGYPITLGGKTLDLTITALQQMRTEGCHYCNGIENHDIKFVKTVTDKLGRSVDAYNTPYHYCPNCSRKLG